MTCALCGGLTRLVLDFGDQALAGGFLKPEDFASEVRYPLSVRFCDDCFLLQVADPVPAETLFGNYFYFSSASRTVREHAREYAERLLESKPRSVLEVGCNDGVLLNQLAGRVERLVGVDPAARVISEISDERIEVINAYFEDVDVGRFDMVVANNVFAHVEDIHGFTASVARAMNPDGVFVFEVHDLVKMLDGLQYDWIYHEHLYYWSLAAIERHLRAHGMRVFHVENVALHGGSRRYFACKDGRPERLTVQSTRNLEKLARVTLYGTFADFARRCHQHAATLRGTLEFMRDDGKTIAGYGASGRAAALIQHSGLGKLISSVRDDAPAKQGYYLPGSHIPIRAEDADYTVVFAWTYLEEILPKVGGPVVVPFPQPGIVARDVLEAA